MIKRVQGVDLNDRITCLKKKYNTFEQAEAQAEHLNNKIENGTYQAKAKKLRVHYCDECDKYHLTGVKTHQDRKDNYVYRNKRKRMHIRRSIRHLISKINHMDKKFNIAHYIILGIWIVMGLDWFFDFFSQEVGISIMICLLIAETIVYSIQVRKLKDHIYFLATFFSWRFGSTFIKEVVTHFLPINNTWANTK